MNLQQAVRAIRALEVRCDELEAKLAESKAPKEKRPYNRKPPNAVIAPESACPSSPMKN